MHRDIKAENVVLTKEGHIKLIDFGLAFSFSSQFFGAQTQKLLEELQKYIPRQICKETYFSRSRRCSFVGTPQFLSPELLQSSSCGEEADVWAFGCLLYYMCTGQLLFSAENQLQVFAKIANMQFELNHPSLSQQAIEVISGCLKKDPQKRLTPKELLQLSFFEGMDQTKVFQTESPLRQRTQNYKPQVIVRSSIYLEQPLQDVITRLTTLNEVAARPKQFVGVESEVKALGQVRQFLFYYPVLIHADQLKGRLRVIKSGSYATIVEADRTTPLKRRGKRALVICNLEVKLVSISQDALVERLLSLGFKFE